jgi:DNA invertase Pin-like site-specific DNA recombinase
MKIGYVRVSSEGDKQNTDMQIDALISVGVDRRNIFEDRASGAKDDRVGLKEAMDYLKTGDSLVVWKLDRLGRSLSHLIKIGRPRAITPEQLSAIEESLKSGVSKASICRMFNIKRSTLYDALGRIV